MLIRNDTPFAAQGFGDLHRDGMRMAVICARGTYQFAVDGMLRLANRQEIALADVYEGDPLRTPLVRWAILSPTSPPPTSRCWERRMRPIACPRKAGRSRSPSAPVEWRYACTVPASGNRRCAD